MSSIANLSKIVKLSELGFFSKMSGVHVGTSSFVQSQDEEYQCIHTLGSFNPIVTTIGSQDEEYQCIHTLSTYSSVSNPNIAFTPEEQQYYTKLARKHVQ
jgi:hypothetical protein